MSGGGGKGGGDTVIGYKYYMGMHIGVCRGPVDSVNSLIFGERVGWSGNVTNSQSIYVNDPDLFGGDKREGGVVGQVDIMMGEDNQLPNPYLAQVINGASSSSGNVSPMLQAIMRAAGSGSGTSTGSGIEYLYTMTSTPDTSGNVRWVVTKQTINNGRTSTETLIDTTSPANSNAESDANAVFVRTSDTTSTTNGLTGQTTWVTDIVVSKIPAYRGVLSLVFRYFQWSSGNPYFKSLWVSLTRIKKGWFKDQCWYPEKAKIGQYDMNPAHIIYQCMTDPEWGMGQSTQDFDDAVWRAAADKLYAEDFGLSIPWTTQSTIKEFVQTICDHINATIRLNMITGLFELVLIRDDYTISDLTELNVDNVLEITSFQRAAWTNLASEVVVKYTTRDNQSASLAVQDPAAVLAQGGIVSTTKEYPGIRTPALASRVALRDLQTASAPLAKVTLKCNRVLWKHAKGDVFRLTWGPLGITDLPFRIIDIKKGQLSDRSIEVEAVEDVFGLPSNAYTADTPTQWVDPVQAAHAVAEAKMVEAPYWDVIRNSSAANFNALPSDFAFASMLAKYGAGASQSFGLYASPTDVSSNFTKVSTGHYAPYAILAKGVAQTDTTLYYVGAVNIDDSVVGSYAYLGDECVVIDSYNATNGTMNVRRGVLDTVPAKHLSGAELWVQNNLGSDITTREAGELVYYRPTPLTGKGELPVGNATSYSIQLKGRAQMPFPPGRFQINGQFYPTKVQGGVALSWAHRDRTQQTVTLQDYTVGNIGPEPGVTYSLSVMQPNATIVRTYIGQTSTSLTYDTPAAVSDGCLQTVRFQLTSSRSGITSWQKHDITIERYGLGFHLGASLGDQL